MNAHGTSTPLNDRSETEAIKAALGEELAGEVPVELDQVGDRAPARRRRRGRGDRHAAGAARPHRAAHAQLRGARRGARPRLRAQRGAPARRTATAARSGSRTRSDSAATTPCSAWRLHERTRRDGRSTPVDGARRCRSRRATHADGVRAPRGALRPGLPARDPLDRAPAARVASAAAGRRRGGRRGHAWPGRPVFCYAQDQTFVGGSLGEAHADTIVRVMQLAGRAGAPVIGFVESGGARMDEGIAALGGYGRIFRESVRLSGPVPADLDHHRRLGRRRRLLAGAHRLRGHDRASRRCS